MKALILLASSSLLVVGPVLAQIPPLWTVPTSRYVFSSPAIDDDGTIYIGSANAKLYAISSSGQVRWTFPTGAEIQSSPAIGKDGTIYFGSCDGKVYALKPDGSKKWDFVTGDCVLSSPALGADGTIYIGSRDGKYYALNRKGEKQWEYVTGQYYTDMPPVIGPDQTIYLNSGSKVVALKPNGQMRWDYEMGGVFVSVVIGKHGGVYATSGGPELKMVALTRRGEKMWQFVFGYPYAVTAASYPAVGRDGTIYISTSDRYLYALTPDGALKWKVAAAAEQSSPALSEDGKIYINSAYDFRLLCFDTNGVPQWNYLMGGEGASGLFASYPTLRDGILYLGCGNGNVYAFAVGGQLVKSTWPAFGRDVKHSGRDIQRDIQAIINPQTGANELELNIEPGLPYTLQGTSDFVTWTDLQTLTSSTNFLVIPRPGGNQNFYRLATPQN